MARGGPVNMPAPLRAVVTYPTLAEIERRFLASMAYKSPRTALSYRDGMKRWDRFLSVASVDPFTQTAEDVPNDVVEWSWKWLIECGYSRATVNVSTAAVLALWRFATAEGLVPPCFTYAAIKDGPREATGRRELYRSPRIDPNLARVVTPIRALALPPADQRGGVALLELLRDKALVLDGHATQALLVGKGRRERHSDFDAEARKAMRAYTEARTDNLAPLFLRHDHRRGRPGQDGETLAAVAAIQLGHRQALRG
jgi:hypothetical protein